MSLESVWTQAIEYLQGQDIPNVRTIFQYPEAQTPTSVFFPKDDPGITTSVAIWSWISKGSEHRFASGPNGPPPNGQKWVSYLLHLNCVMRTNYKTNGISDAAQLAAADMTTFIDNLRTTIRYSRNAGGSPVGTGTAVFQWGEGQDEHWGPDIEWKTEIPQMIEGAGVAGQMQIRTRVDVWVCETINS